MALEKKGSETGIMKKKTRKMLRVKGVNLTHRGKNRKTVYYEKNSEPDDGNMECCRPSGKGQSLGSTFIERNMNA